MTTSNKVGACDLKDFLQSVYNLTCDDSQLNDGYHLLTCRNENTVPKEVKFLFGKDTYNAAGMAYDIACQTNNDDAISCHEAGNNFSFYLKNSPSGLELTNGHIVSCASEYNGDVMPEKVQQLLHIIHSDHPRLKSFWVPCTW